MKILVTGANGFIGKSLCGFFQNLHHEVSGTVRAIDHRSPSAIKLFGLGNINGDTNWQPCLKGVEVIYHLAGLAHRPDILDLEVYKQSIVDATFSLMKQAQDAGVRRLIYMSSVSVYGFESHEDYIDERNVKMPKTPYARAKAMAEDGLLNCASKSGTEIVIVRPPLVYGKQVKGNFYSLIKLINQIRLLPFGKAHNKRSFVSISNLVNFLNLCATHPMANQQIFNITDDQDMSTFELSTLITQALEKKTFYVPVPLSLMRHIAKGLRRDSIYQKLFGSLRFSVDYGKNLLGWEPDKNIYLDIQAAVRSFN